MLFTAFAAMEHAHVERDAVDLKVLATDISQRSIDLGRRGWFDESQVCDVPALVRDRYFVEAQGGVEGGVEDGVKDGVKDGVDAAKALLASRGVLCSGFDEEALVAIDDDDEVLWQSGLRSLVRSQGHC